MGTETDSQVLKRLAAWVGPLPEELAFYRQLLIIQSGARANVGVPQLHLDGAAMTMRLGRGEPLLRFDDLALDWPRFRGTLERVVSLIESYPEVFASASDLRSSIIDEGALKATTQAWFDGPSSGMAIPGGTVGELALGAAIKPFLAAHADALIGRVDQEMWRRGYCPVCGGNADLAFLKEDGARWLLCSRCDAAWLFQRLECPGCGNQSQGTLAYFTDDSGRYRLYVCEQCRQYLKAIDLRRAAPDVLLSLERFLTLDLDIQAQSDGYRPCCHHR